MIATIIYMSILLFGLAVAGREIGRTLYGIWKDDAGWEFYRCDTIMWAVLYSGLGVITLVMFAAAIVKLGRAL